MDYETQKVIKEWDEEVAAEMRKLIREGTPPIDAAGKARDNVSRRRKIAAMPSGQFLSIGYMQNKGAA